MLPPHVSRQLAQALQGLQYGTVQLVVHEARIVRIERVERIRLTDTPEAAAENTSGQPTPPTEEGHPWGKE